MTYKETLRQVFIYLRPRTPYPPPQHTVHVYACTNKYTYYHREGGEGGELNQREGEMGNSLQIWVENTNMTDCIASLKTPATGKFF